MRVKKAIEILKGANPEAPMILHNLSCNRKVVNVLTNSTETVVWFEDYSDESRHLSTDELNISEIISLLETFNPEAMLKFHSETGPDVLFIYTYSPETKHILAFGEWDTCMQSEIAVLFYDLQYTDETELDVYKYLFSLDINIDMFRKYFGENEAQIAEKAYNQIRKGMEEPPL